MDEGDAISEIAPRPHSAIVVDASARSGLDHPVRLNESRFFREIADGTDVAIRLVTGSEALLEEEAHVKKSIPFSVRAVVLAVLATVGCAAEEDEDEEVGTSEESVVYFPKVKFSPDDFMDRAAERARTQCRFTRDESGALSGPYGLVTVTVRAGNGVVSNAAIYAPHAGTPIGRCITRAIGEMKVPENASFERTKRFTIKAPSGG